MGACVSASVEKPTCCTVRKSSRSLHRSQKLDFKMGFSTLLLLISAITLTYGNLSGENVCSRNETVNVSRTAMVSEPVTIRSYKWCLKVPPRCSQYHTEMKNVIKVEYETQIRTVDECCPGFSLEETESRCVPFSSSSTTVNPYDETDLTVAVESSSPDPEETSGDSSLLTPYHEQLRREASHEIEVTQASDTFVVKAPSSSFPKKDTRMEKKVAPLKTSSVERKAPPELTTAAPVRGEGEDSTPKMQPQLVVRQSLRPPRNKTLASPLATTSTQRRTGRRRAHPQYIGLNATSLEEEDGGWLNPNPLQEEEERATTAEPRNVPRKKATGDEKKHETMLKKKLASSEDLLPAAEDLSSELTKSVSNPKDTITFSEGFAKEDVHRKTNDGDDSFLKGPRHEQLKESAPSDIHLHLGPPPMADEGHKYEEAGSSSSWWLVPGLAVAAFIAALVILVLVIVSAVVISRRRRAGGVSSVSDEAVVEMRHLPPTTETTTQPSVQPVFLSPVYLPPEGTQVDPKTGAGLIVTAVISSATNNTLQGLYRHHEQFRESVALTTPTHYDVPASTVRRRDNSQLTSKDSHVYEELPCWNGYEWSESGQLVVVASSTTTCCSWSLTLVSSLFCSALF